MTIFCDDVAPDVLESPHPAQYKYPSNSTVKWHHISSSYHSHNSYKFSTSSNLLYNHELQPWKRYWWPQLVPFSICCNTLCLQPIPEANLNNPKTSEESKQHSREVIDQMEQSGYTAQGDRDEFKNEGNVIGGHKVILLHIALHLPLISSRPTSTTQTPLMRPRNTPAAFLRRRMPHKFDDCLL